MNLKPSAPLRPLPGGHAFSLIELLAVIAICGLLLTILGPAINRTREKAMQNSCASQLRQIMAASLLYSTDNDNSIPLVLDAESRRWSNHLQPYLGVDQQLTRDPASVFHCDSDNIKRNSTTGDICSYGLNIRVHTAGNANNTSRQKRMSDIPSPAKTILYGDAWRNDNIIQRALSLQVAMGDHHRSGSNYVFADGHVEFLPHSTVMETTPPATQPNRIAIPD